MNISNNPNIPTLDPQALLGGVTLDEIRKTAATSIQKALELLGTAIAGGFLKNDEAPGLEAPKTALMQKVADLTLRIALLQQALDELQTQVSKTVIEGRMNEVDKTHKEQLENLEKQMKEMQEAIDKQKEAKQKSNVFTAIASWVMAAVDFVSAAFSVIAAVGNALVGNVAGAAGLLVAAGAQIASGICNVIMAVDATIMAAGGKGFLSDADKQALQGVMIACAVVAGVAGLIGGLGAITTGLKEAFSVACKELVKQGVQQGFGASMRTAWTIAKEVACACMKNLANPFARELTEKGLEEITKATMKELAKEAAKTGSKEISEEIVKAVVKAAYKAFEEIFMTTAEYALRQGVTNGIFKGGTQIAGAAIKLEVLKMEAEAANSREEAEMAEAAAKALEAFITLLRKTIDDLQAQLEEMINASMETMSIIFGAIDDCAETMKELHQSQPA